MTVAILAPKCGPQCAQGHPPHRGAEQRGQAVAQLRNTFHGEPVTGRPSVRPDAAR